MSSLQLTLFMACALTLIAVLTAAMVRFAPVAYPAAAGGRPAAGIIIVLIGWLIAAVGLASTNVYVAEAGRMPTIQFGIVTPIVLGVLAYCLEPGFRAFVRGLPQPWLIGIQLYRALGGIFMVLWAAGQLPALFAWPAGIGDVLVGLAAPLVAYFAARSPEKARGAIIAWNLLGILDLAVALTTGFLTSPSRFQMFAFDAPNTMVAQFPLVLIPTFLVPLSILLHLASLASLGGQKRSDTGAPV